MHRRQRSPHANQEVVISVNSTKAMTVSDYSKVAKLINKQKSIHNASLPKLQEPFTTLQKSVEKDHSNRKSQDKHSNGSFSLEQGHIKSTLAYGTAVKFNFMRNHQLTKENCEEVPLSTIIRKNNERSIYHQQKQQHQRNRTNPSRANSRNFVMTTQATPYNN